MSHKIAKRVRKALKEMGINPSFAKYNPHGTVTLTEDCGRKLYQDTKRNIKKGM